MWKLYVQNVDVSEYIMIFKQEISKESTNSKKVYSTTFFVSYKTSAAFLMYFIKESVKNASGKIQNF